jgi:hypothetical protein
MYFGVETVCNLCLLFAGMILCYCWQKAYTSYYNEKKQQEEQLQNKTQEYTGVITDGIKAFYQIGLPYMGLKLENRNASWINGDAGRAAIESIARKLALLDRSRRESDPLIVIFSNIVTDLVMSNCFKVDNSLLSLFLSGLVSRRNNDSTDNNDGNENTSQDNQNRDNAKRSSGDSSAVQPTMPHKTRQSNNERDDNNTRQDSLTQGNNVPSNKTRYTSQVESNHTLDGATSNVNITTTNTANTTTDSRGGPCSIRPRLVAESPSEFTVYHSRIPPSVTPSQAFKVTPEMTREYSIPVKRPRLTDFMRIYPSTTGKYKR